MSKFVYSCVVSCCIEKSSLATDYPQIAAMLHPTKNRHHTEERAATAEDFTSLSKQTLWWQCPSEESHVFRSRPRYLTSQAKQKSITRIMPNGCPYCPFCKKTKNGTLKQVFPELAKFWDYTKNGDRTPEQTTINSHRKVWWTDGAFKSPRARLLSKKQPVQLIKEELQPADVKVPQHRPKYDMLLSTVNSTH